MKNSQMHLRLFSTFLNSSCKKVLSAKMLLVDPKCKMIWCCWNVNFPHIAIAILDLSILLPVKLQLLIFFASFSIQYQFFASFSMYISSLLHFLCISVLCFIFYEYQFFTYSLDFSIFITLDPTIAKLILFLILEKRHNELTNAQKQRD